MKRKTISLGGSVRKQFQQILKIRNTFVIIVAALMNSAYICTTNWGYSWYLKESEILLRWLFLYWCHVHGYTRCKQARSIVLEMGGGGGRLNKKYLRSKKTKIILGWVGSVPLTSISLYISLFPYFQLFFIRGAT